MNEKIRAINDKRGKTSLQLHHEKKKNSGEGKNSRYEICKKKNTVWHRIQYPHWKSSDQHSHQDKHGWVENTKHIKKNNNKNPTNKFNTHFAKTHYEQTLKRNKHGCNVQGFFSRWVMDAATMLFLKRNENILQLTADDV